MIKSEQMNQKLQNAFGEEYHVDCGANLKFPPISLAPIQKSHVLFFSCFLASTMHP